MLDASFSTPTLRESFAYGEDFVFANRRRQGGNEERNSELLINCDADNGGDVDLSARRQPQLGISVQLEVEDRIQSDDGPGNRQV